LTELEKRTVPTEHAAGLLPVTDVIP
jgi:hypothetical protein